MNQELTPRQRFIVAAMAAAPDSSFAPVQLQKFFFLIDANIAEEGREQWFAFEPHNYGPFDRQVYSELEALTAVSMADIHGAESSPAMRSYSLSPSGQEFGIGELKQHPSDFKEYLAEVSSWVRNQSFAELVGAIYKVYPEMRVNSVFKD